ncbi:MAG: hypothetical protein OIF50_04645 [Flavobacteriaceae bacterium]|nr:hypothetical protein [Flavobacteriaceae bacterium]
MANTEQTNIRINYSKYEVDELSETIADAIFFPLYIGKVLLQNSLLLAGILIVLACYVSQGIWGASLYYFLCYTVSIPSLLLFSVIRLFTTIRNDLNKVFDIAIDTTKFVYDDSKKLRQQRKAKVPLKQSFTDVFKGVSLFVIRPSLKRVLHKRLRIFAYPLSWIIDGIFRFVFLRKTPEFHVQTDNNDKIEVYLDKMDHKISSKSNWISNATFGLLKFPFRLVLFFYACCNFFLIYVFTLLIY